MVVSFEEDVFTDFYLLLRISNLCGFTSSKIKERSTSRKYLVHQKWHYLIHVVLKILSCMCGYCSLKIYSIYYNMHGNLLLILNVVVQVTSIITHVASSICNSAYVNKNRKLWQRLYHMEKDLSTLGVTVNHKILWRTGLACVVFITIFTTYSVITSISLYIALRDDIENALIFGNCLFYLYDCGMYCIVICQHISSFSVLREIFLKLQDATKIKFLCNRPSRPTDLLKIARFHQRSCEVARLANSVVSVQLLVVLLSIFCLAIANSFTSAVYLMDERYASQRRVAVYSGGWFTFSILFVTALAVFSRKCVKSVS